MSAAVLLALAAQVVTLRPTDIETKAAYVRVGVGVESRLTLPEPAVRVRGQQSAKELLGLRLGQVRPKAVLLIRPREAGTARLVFEGATHRIRLEVEASVLGAAQDVEFRIGEPVVAVATPAPSKPTPAPTPKAAPVSAPQPKREAAAPARRPDVKPAPATTRTAQVAGRKPDQSPVGVASPKPRAAGGVPAALPSSASVQGAVPTPLPSAVAVAPSPGPETTSDRAAARTIDAGPAPLPTATPSAPPAAKRQVARIGRYVGMPGQRGVWVDELVRDGARVSLRLRVEGGAGAVEISALDIEGTQATVRTEVAGKDLVVIGEVPLPAQKPRQATLAMAERGRFRKEKLKLVGPGLADQMFDGGRSW